MTSRVDHLARRRLLGLGASLVAGGPLMTCAPLAMAAIGGLPSNVAHDASSPEWEVLRSKLFGTRPIATGQDSQVQLVVPLRAAFGASVPVKVVSKIEQRPELFVQRMIVLVDKNPSPLAATLQFSVDAGRADIETRIRVDEYSHVRVVTELSNGDLHMDSRYAKVSGGCSAPSNRGPVENIGRTVLRLPEVALAERGVRTADVTVAHPNDTGFEMNEVTLLFIPAYFVRSMQVSFEGRRIFDADMDFSMSENPSFRFCFAAREGGELRAEVQDSKDRRFTGSLAV